MDPKEFIEMRMRDGPFDPETYGEDIEHDAERVELIEKVRSAIRSTT